MFTTEDLRQTRFYQDVIQEGIQQGIQQGQAELTLNLLRRKFGSLSPAQETQLRQLPVADLQSLAEALLEWSCPEDLETWLQHGR
ncbi:DUF4351 domain-containing protein [Thermostichus vulcanus]|uniref:DUF4351 domain-containing protein n=1 Tax=Thermostichus vulcanus str. 'Rupite' TaxID=2813851 RepID=A0ABT0CEY9_THEVL|nr:DUF4351 domain-containing protein [Thermostichus vulcanus]MCJ2544289.1 DUF4351 domain-containing protein [Thermostichus vulcanus str. 'Rupite']